MQMKQGWMVALLLMASAGMLQAQYNYTTNSDNTITITAYTGAGGDVTIPGTIDGLPVTHIGNEAFGDYNSLTSITIPDSVIGIGDAAFYECENLTNATIGCSVISIGYCAFYECENLIGVTIGNGVKNIAEGAFGYCYDLTSVNIPDSVISIGDWSFYGCYNLTNLTIGNSVTYIGEEAFYDCESLTNATIGNSVTYIGEDAFEECYDLTSVTIPNSVICIGDDAFEECESLTSVTIPNSVTSIGEEAFYECENLTNATIGNSVTYIGEEAFYDCESLTSIKMGNNVSSIDDYAFEDCDNLNNIYFTGNAPSLAGADVFDGNTNIVIHYLPGTTGWGSTFAGCPTTLWKARKLTVVSEYGNATPPVGVNWFDAGAVMNSCVTTPDTRSTEQYICRGWTASGSLPAGGKNANTGSFALSNNSTITWSWKTNCFLSTKVHGGGSVNVTSAWYACGSTVTITATPTSGRLFAGWTGDTKWAPINGTNITVKMNSGKSITANFGFNLTVQAMGLDNSKQKANIIVTPNDYLNQGSGITPFVRPYATGAAVTLNAPAALNGGWQFTGWTGVDSFDGTTATLTITSNTVARAWYDPAPTITITNPTSSSTYTATNQVLNAIMGRASNQCGIVSVQFSDNRGGSGQCTGTTNWSYTGGITLYNGTNIITVTAYDAYGNSASDALKVNYSSKYSKLQNLELLEGGVVRSINMQDGLLPGVTNTIQWQVEAFEPILSALKIHLPVGGSVTNAILNGALTGAPTNGASLIGDWQSMVYSFETNWIMPSSTSGTYHVSFLTAREDGYAYVNANIPDGIDSRPYGTDGKAIARDIGAGATAEVQNDTLIKTSPTFETIGQALYRRGAVVQNIQITNSLTPGNVVTCRWSILSYPNLSARMDVDLPNGSNFVGIATFKATSNSWWRIPTTGTLVEYNGSVSNDPLTKVSSYYVLRNYYYEYAWKVPTNNNGACGITFEVTPSSSPTNWVDAILPKNVDAPNTTDGVTIERQIGP